MRKLKLQVQMTLDGFVGGPDGELDWMWIGERDEATYLDVIEIANSCDTILMGRKMATGFLTHWENVVDNLPDSPELVLAQRMVAMGKIIFSHTQTHITGRNATMENGDLATVVKALKAAPGKDLLVYGGADFVQSLISLNLVDEFYIFRSPVAIGKGLSIFTEQKLLKLADTKIYKNGKVLSKFLPL